MSFCRTLLAAAVGIACLAAPLAHAADQQTVSKPALYAAVAAKATGGVCSGVLSLADMNTLQLYIDRYLAVDREASGGKASEGVSAIVATELHSTYTQLRRGPGGCSEDQINDAREQLRRVSFHADRPEYWDGVRNPPPHAGDAIVARVIGRKCLGLFDVDQTALLDRFIRSERERLRQSANLVDFSWYDGHLTTLETQMSGGWWFPWHCTRAVMRDARVTLQRIETLMARRAQH